MRNRIPLFICSTFLAASAAFAGLVDAVSIVVNDRPVTLYEIYKTQKSLGIPKTKAVELLIKKRIKEEELQRLGIDVDDFDVVNEIEKIARQNGIDTLKMRTILAKQGVEWEEYKKRVKEKLLQDRLYRRILSTKIQNPSDETLREYYKLHLNSFSVPQKRQTLETEKLDKELTYILTRTPKGQFTQIIPVDGRYVLFLVQEFVNPEPLPFEKAKDRVFAMWMEQKQQEAIESHFEKLRAAADVKVLRAP